ncbi:hypothetical protein MN608_10125 [Microdochium nivale]|nr:hypothetical protein MN608_10125 [Microdochium nivale]
MWQLGSGLKSKQIMTCVPNNPLNETTSAWWDGDIGAIDPKVQHVVFLILSECNSSAPKFYSHYFNLTSPADAASNSAATAPPSSSTATTSPGTLPTQPTGATSPAPAPAAGLSDAAVLAAGIGGASAARFSSWLRRLRSGGGVGAGASGGSSTSIRTSTTILPLPTAAATSTARRPR